MAIGLALLMGFVFPQNFNSPYRATGFRDFWRRWHMTLSRFLRDYLYIPLGRQPQGPAAHLPQPDVDDGPRRPLARRLLELRALGRLPRRRAGRPSTRSTAGSAAVPGWLRWFVTFNLVVFGWILFRSQDLDLFWTTSRRSFSRRRGDLSPSRWSARSLLVIGAAAAARAADRGHRAAGRAGSSRSLLGAALAVVILLVGATVPSQGVPPFIYFRF